MFEKFMGSGAADAGWRNIERALGWVSRRGADALGAKELQTGVEALCSFVV